MRLLLLTFTLSYSLQSFPQEDDCEAFLMQFATNQNRLESVENLPMTHAVDSAFCATCYHELAITYYRAADLQTSILLAQRASEIRRGLADTISLKKSLFNLGFFQRREGNTLGSIQTFMMLTDLSPEDNTTAKAHTQLGALYTESGDFHNALIHLEYASNLFQREGSVRELYKNYLEISRVYAEMGTATHAQEMEHLFDKIDSLATLTPIDHRDQVIIYQRKASLYDDLKKFPEALTAYQLAEESQEPNDPLYLLTLNNMAVTERRMQYYDRSELHLLTVIDQTDEVALKAMAYNNLGDLLLETNRESLAKDAYETTVMLYTQQESGKFSYPQEQLIRNTPYKTELLQAIMSLGEFYWLEWLSDKEINSLRESIHCMYLADQVIEMLVYESAVYESRLFWRSQAALVYQRAVSATFALQDYEQVHYFMERNKAFLLLMNLNRLQAQQSALIPDQVIHKAEKLAQRVARLQHSAFEDSSNFIQLHEAQFAFQQFQDSIKRTFPAYVGYLEQSHVLTLQEHQENLSSDQLDVLYLMGEEACYVLVVAENPKMFQVPLSAIQNQLKVVNMGVSRPFRNADERNDFAKAAHSLYQQLMAPVLEGSDPKVLRISADGVLQQLNFEMLATSPRPENLASSYLIQRYQVDYVYSFTHHSRNQQLTRDNPKGLAVYTPGSFVNTDLSDLPGTLREGRKITEMMDASFYQSEEASKYAFIRSLTTYKQVHLASHADLTAHSEPRMYLYDEELFASEIYSLHATCELVVLSACGTSQGVVADGEGVMSVARALVYAGVGEVICTIGNINDGSSEKLISRFYLHLKKSPPSIALRQAKLDYLNQAEGSGVSPYHWANFICMGSDPPSSTSSWLWIFGVMVGGLILVYWRWHSR